MSENSTSVRIHFIFIFYYAKEKLLLNLDMKSNATIDVTNVYILIVLFQMQENESSDEEEVEPKLKYVRISNDLKRILSKDAVSCIAVHSKVKFQLCNHTARTILMRFICFYSLQCCSFCVLERIGVLFIYWIIKATPLTHP